MTFLLLFEPRARQGLSRPLSVWPDLLASQFESTLGLGTLTVCFRSK